MKLKTVLLISFTAIFIYSCKNSQEQSSEKGKFDLEKDLLLANYDCKTDVDDLQSVAALATLLSGQKYSAINVHAVAGAYGIQEGLYVPPNELFNLAFGTNWSDAHENLPMAVNRVKTIAKSILENQGNIWIAELSIKERIHIVQHSDWNEEVTSPASLDFVKKNTDYEKIPDGNAVGNGTPGFRSPEYTGWKDMISNTKLLEIWQLAIELSNRYNGKEGRYHNEAISAGGLDFSDTSEVCWILGLDEIMDSEDFFNLFSN